MTEPALSNRTLARLPAALRGRRRSAPKHERTSDVTRPRGWLVGSLSAGLALALGLAWTPAEQLSPSPRRAISRPHQGAGLSCASCHADTHPGPATAEHDPADACVGCHADQRSTRPPHAKLLAEGQLRCTTCHQIHTAMGGVTFEPGGPAIRWRNGVEQPLAEFDGVDASYAGRAPTTVPLVELSACMNCHDPSRADDPMAHCALGPRRGPRDVAVCFDEHTPLLVAAGSDRAALWELSREAAALGAPTPSEADDGGGGRWSALALLLGLSFGAGAGGLGLTRALAARRDRKLNARAVQAGADGPAETAAGEPAPQLRPAERQRLPTINTTTCIGCSACVDACPYDVLELRAYVATVAKPDDCCGLTLCEQRCPNGSLIVTEGEPIAELPRLDDDLAALGAPGIYLAGDVTGLPLIRNAINSGSHAVKSICRTLPTATREAIRAAGALDLVIVGAGPAGISAALEATERGLRYVVLEQASAAESIRSFPRGKLVFDQPLGMPMVGDLWLAESSKEELLGKWLRIIRQQSLDIRERVRVDGCERLASGHLRVRASEIGDAGAERPVSFDAARILLACGRRGTPRPLAIEIPDAMIDHVHYSLADARSFAGQRVCVVGLGDVAMEAAIGLAHQTNTEVYVSYRGSDFKRGKRRNVVELERLAAAGRVELIWSSEITAVDAGGRIELDTPAGPRRIELDALFVMIGNLPPTKLLDSFGVERSTAEIN